MKRMDLRRRRRRVFTAAPARSPVMASAAAVEEFLLSRRGKPSTLEWYRDKLMRLAAVCPTLPTSAAQIDRFLAGLTCTDEGKDGYWRAFHAFFSFMEQRHRLLSPMGDVARQKPKRKDMRFLCPLELNHVLAQDLSLRDRALLSFYSESGSRSSEGIIRWRDIHPETLTVSVSGKTGSREVPITLRTLRLLEALRPAGAKADDFVFCEQKSKKRRPLTYWGIYQAVKRAMLGAGLGGKHLGAHTFRHTFADIYLERGGNPFDLQEILGHTTLAMVQEYIRRRKIARIAAVHNRFSPLAAAEEAGQLPMPMTGPGAVEAAEELLRREPGERS